MRSIFYQGYNGYEGDPPTLYRSTEEIGKDIGRIRARICEVYEMLNVRRMLEGAMNAYAGSEPESWIPRLRALVEDADSTLSALFDLRGSLDILKAELEDAKWALED